MARRLWAVASLHVVEKTDHDWVVGQFDRAMNGARAVVRARSGPMNHKWLRDGVTTVEAVPTMIKHQSCHVAKTHYDDFNTGRSHRGLNSLNSSLEATPARKLRLILPQEGGVRCRRFTVDARTQTRARTYRRTRVGRWPGTIDV